MKTKQTTGFRWSYNTMTIILYCIAAFFLVIMQMAPRFFPVIAQARPEPLILFVVCVAMFEGPQVGAVVGVVAGLLWDMYTIRVFGFQAVLMVMIGVAVGLLVQWILRTNFISAMLLCVGAVLVHTLLEWLICYVLFMHEETIPVLLSVYLPNALYTVVLAPLTYGCVLLTARFLRRRKKR